MRRTAAVVALLVLLITVGAVGASSAQGGENAGAAARNLTLEDLRPGGSKPANAPDSIRQNGRYGEFAVKALPTGLMVDESEDSQSWRYLRPKQTVKRNYLQLWSKRAYDAPDQKYVVEIAHFKEGTETVTDEDGNSRQREVAKNVSTYARTVTFAGGYDYAKIDLEPHHDQKMRTVMCVRTPGEASCLDNPGETRWTFYHQSSKATMPIDTNSAGGRLAWAIGVLVLPFFGFTTVTLYVGKKFLDTAKAGPGISAVWWVVALVVALLGTILAWDSVAETLIRAPWVAAGFIGIILGVIAVEWFGRRSYGVGFLQFELTEGYDPTDPADVEEALENTPDDDLDELAQNGKMERPETGDDRPQDAPGVLKAQFEIAQFARGDDGERSVIRSGIRKFWARARGATADLEVDGNMQTRVDVDGPIEELFLLDPEAEDPLEYEPEHHTLEWPDLITYDEDGNRQLHPVPWLAGLATLGFSYVAGGALLGNSALGLLAAGLGIFAFKIAQPREGRLHANLAPVHYNHAVAGMLTHARRLGEAKNWQDWFREYTESEAARDADTRELKDDRARTQLEEISSRYLNSNQDAPTRGSREDDQEAPADD